MDCSVNDLFCLFSLAWHNSEMNVEDHLIGRSLDFNKAEGNNLIFEAKILEEDRHPYWTSCIAGSLTLVAVICIHLIHANSGTLLSVFAVIPSAAYFAYHFILCLTAYRRITFNINKVSLTISESSGFFGAVHSRRSLSQVRVIYADEISGTANKDHAPSILLMWKDRDMQGEFLNMDYSVDRQKFISWLRDHQVPILPSAALILDDAAGE